MPTNEGLNSQFSRDNLISQNTEHTMRTGAEGMKFKHQTQPSVHNLNTNIVTSNPTNITELSGKKGEKPANISTTEYII